MPDITAIVVIGALTAALYIFVIGALIKRWSDPGGGAGCALPPKLPVGRVPVWFYKPVDLLGAGFVFVVFGALVMASVRGVGQEVHALKPSTLLMSIGFQLVMAGVVASMVVRRVGWVVWLGLRWPGWQWVILLGPGAVLFMWAVFGGLQVSGYVEWMESLGVETVQESVKLLQKSEDPAILGLMAVAAVVVAPLCEEVVFRGYFYPVLKKFAGFWPAVICSAVVFASAHGNLTAMLPLFIFGGLLVLIYEKTGSLWAPIAVHCCFNSATVIVQAAARIYHWQLDAMP